MNADSKIDRNPPSAASLANWQSLLQWVLHRQCPICQASLVFRFVHVANARSSLFEALCGRCNWSLRQTYDAAMTEHARFPVTAATPAVISQRMLQAFANMRCLQAAYRRLSSSVKDLIWSGAPIESGVFVAHWYEVPRSPPVRASLEGALTEAQIDLVTSRVETRVREYLEVRPRTVWTAMQFDHGLGECSSVVTQASMLHLLAFQSVRRETEQMRAALRNWLASGVPVEDGAYTAALVRRECRVPLAWRHVAEVVGPYLANVLKVQASPRANRHLEIRVPHSNFDPIADYAAGM